MPRLEWIMLQSFAAAAGDVWREAIECGRDVRDVTSPLTGYRQQLIVVVCGLHEIGDLGALKHSACRWLLHRLHHHDASRGLLGRRGGAIACWLKVEAGFKLESATLTLHLFQRHPQS